MYKKISYKSVSFILLVACSTNMCMAQGLQNFINNTENKIQQDSSVGGLNSSQSSALQNKQAQIMYQEQQDKNQNGGNLTRQERNQIAGEERGLTQQTNQDLYKNNPNAANLNNNWQNRPNSGWNQNNANFQNQNWQSQQNLRNWNQNQPNQFNANGLNQNQGQPNQFNGQYRRHHRQWQQ